MSEIDFYGVFVPVLLIQAALAYALYLLTSRWIDRLEQRGWIFYPNIFYLCWYVVCLFVVHAIYQFFLH